MLVIVFTYSISLINDAQFNSEKTTMIKEGVFIVMKKGNVSLDEKLRLMGQGIGNPNIITMILIFMVAGIFVGVVGRSSADSVAYFILSIIPAQYSVAVLFAVS